MNASTVANGVLSVVSVTLAPGSNSLVSIGLRNAIAASASGISIGATGSGGTITVGQATGPQAPGDGNADGKTDLIWTNDATAQAAYWFMGGSQGNQELSSAWISSSASPGWRIIGAADFNADGRPDIVWINTATHQVAVWFMTGTPAVQQYSWSWLNATVISGWTPRGIGDFNRDGHPDIVWVNDQTRQAQIWYLGAPPATGGQIAPGGQIPLLGAAWLNLAGALGWNIAAVADFNADGIPDVIWVNDATRQAAVWLMGGPDGTQQVSWQWITPGGAPGWSIAGAADFNGDGTADVVWCHDGTRQVAVWYLSAVPASPGGQIPSVGWAWINQNGAPGWTPLVGS